MSQEIIDRYKSTLSLKYDDADVEIAYKAFTATRGKSTSTFAFLILCLLSAAFAYLEFYALGLSSDLPMYLFFGLSAFFLLNLGISLLDVRVFLKSRMILSALLIYAAILLPVLLFQYRPYYTMEAMLIILWVSVFSRFHLRGTILSIVLYVGMFVGVLHYVNESNIKIVLVTVMLFASGILGMFVSYLWERMRRMLFMTHYALEDVSSRQEVWAYTLIDMDMALSGIKNFKELLNRVMEFMGTAITYDSYVVTALEGQGPKPKPIKIEGELFQDEDKTLWNDELISKLEQTRQAYSSSQFTERKNWLGSTVRDFQHFRLDVPLFNDFGLAGIISLRRENKDFDDLDMTASVSIASQGMLIFSRSTVNSPSSVMHSKNLYDVEDITPYRIAEDMTPTNLRDDVSQKKAESSEDSDLSLTETTPNKFLKSSPNLSIAPKDIRDSFKKHDAEAKKSIVILSREKADKVGLDKYRQAVHGGESLSFVIMEIDGLSAIRENDGDKVAYRVFSSIAKQLFLKLDRANSIVGRYGKNGMSVVMYKVDMNAAEMFAEQFRKLVESTEYKTVYGVRKATLSIGVAAVTDDSGDYPAMVKRADMALFVAKKNGRNSVKVRL